MGQHLQILNTGDQGYTLLCESCSNECTSVALIDGFFIGRCCSPSYKPAPAAPTTDIIKRLRLVKQNAG